MSTHQVKGTVNPDTIKLTPVTLPMEARGVNKNNCLCAEDKKGCAVKKGCYPSAIIGYT